MKKERVKKIIERHIDALHHVDKIQDVNAKDGSGRYNSPALLRAARYGMIERCRELIKRGADINGEDDDGETALFWAIKNGRRELCQVLADAEANLDHRNKDNHTPLDFVAGQSFEFAMFLISLGSKPESMTKRMYRTSLMILFGAKNGDLDMVQNAVMEGTSLDVKFEGKTPIQLARENHHDEVVQFLIDHGASYLEEEQQREVAERRDWDERYLEAKERERQTRLENERK